MNGWDDDRLDGALAALRDTIDVDGEAELDPAPPIGAATPARWRRLLAAAAVVALVATGVTLVIPDAREAVARWLGIGNVDIEQSADAPDPDGLDVFLAGIAPLPVDDAVADLGPAGARLDAAGLGPPATAGHPPEGGVVVAWDDGAVTLWAIAATDAVLIDKQLGPEDDAELITGVGTDIAVLVDGPHVLRTPVRTVAADRLVWWIDGDVQYRLEADRSRNELIDLARALAN